MDSVTQNSVNSGGPRRGWHQLSVGALGVTLGFAFCATLLLTLLFTTSFWELLARTSGVALLLLWVFITVQGWPAQRLPTWLPRWVLTLVAMGVMAPLATFVMYLFAVRGDLPAFVGNPARVSGFAIITVTALVLGLLIALGAQLRQREAESHAQSLRFALERSQLERQALDAQLSLLQAQVQPHFLFNTLANVQALVESGSPRAAEVLKSLIAYLRAAVPRLQGGPTTLGDELALVRSYLALMQMRMPDRLSFSVEVDAALNSHPMPALAVLTLVENAVRHGIDPSEGGGRIEVGATAPAGGALRLWVRDTGVGLNPRSGTGLGTGLTNLRARLAALHGPTATLQFSEVLPHGVLAEIQLPIAY
jgi:signal transduction histidine kinase